MGARLAGHAPEGLGRLRTMAGLAYHAKNGGIAGAGLGAAYGAVTGLMDEDSSMIGGAIRGGIYGGAMGIAASRGLYALRGKTGGMFPRTRTISPGYRENLSYWKAMDAENVRRYDDVAAPFVDDRSFYSDVSPAAGPSAPTPSGPPRRGRGKKRRTPKSRSAVVDGPAPTDSLPDVMDSRGRPRINPSRTHDVLDDFTRPTTRTGIPTSRNPINFSDSPIFDRKGGRL